VHRTSAGFRPHFRDSGPNGGFGVWQLFPPNPALAGNASRWAVPSSHKFQRFKPMVKQIISNIKKADLSLLDKIVLRVFGIGFLVVACSFCLWIFFWYSGLGTISVLLWCSWKDSTVDSSPMPVYPNAQNIIREEPHDLSSTYKFTTNDNPETVWKFYVDEGERRGFQDKSQPNSPKKSLVNNSCSSTRLDMTSISIDPTTYSITILTHFEPYR
jgi:hypothetical protein